MRIYITVIPHFFRLSLSLSPSPLVVHLARPHFTSCFQRSACVRRTNNPRHSTTSFLVYIHVCMYSYTTVSVCTYETIMRKPICSMRSTRQSWPKSNDETRLRTRLPSEHDRQRRRRHVIKIQYTSVRRRRGANTKSGRVVFFFIFIHSNSTRAQNRTARVFM